MSDQILMPSVDPSTGEPSLLKAPPTPAETAITVSAGLNDWLRQHAVSFAVTSYQTGQLFLVGAHPRGTVSFNQQSFERAMGVCWTPRRLYLGSLFQLWRLEDMLRPGEMGNQHFDSVLVPRNAQTTGDVDIHELGIDDQGRVLFVNTKYSCLCRLDLTHSFEPIWKPPFISKLAPEDRCHLNGLAMDKGRPRYVTAVSSSDVLSGWRGRRHDGGVLFDVSSGLILTNQLSMPHSPRLVGRVLYVLDSGRGRIAQIDPSTGVKTDLAFCPGFLRGLAVHNGHAIVTVSKPRDGTFKGLALDAEMQERNAAPRCGVMIVDLSTGDIVEWIRFEGQIIELFDVAVMPGIRCPMSIGPNTIEIQNTITFQALPSTHL